MILTAQEIKDLCLIKCEVTDRQFTNDSMITPFVEDKISQNDEGQSIPSFGLSHCGYDVRLASHWKIANHNIIDTLDTLNPNHDFYIEVEADSIVIPPHGSVYARTVEYFRIPNNIMASPFCKSTLARQGITMPPTIVEPGWEGNLVLEIFNHNPFPARIHAGVGMAQMVFFELNNPTNPYNGKYQGQTGITLAR